MTVNHRAARRLPVSPTVKISLLFATLVSVLLGFMYLRTQAVHQQEQEGLFQTYLGINRWKTKIGPPFNGLSTLLDGCESIDPERTSADAIAAQRAELPKQAAKISKIEGASFLPDLGQPHNYALEVSRLLGNYDAFLDVFQAIGQSKSGRGSEALGEVLRPPRLVVASNTLNICFTNRVTVGEVLYQAAYLQLFAEKRPDFLTGAPLKEIRAEENSIRAQIAAMDRSGLFKLAQAYGMKERSDSIATRRKLDHDINAAAMIPTGLDQSYLQRRLAEGG